MDRRYFIGKSAASLAAFTIVPSHVLAGSGRVAPSDQLTRAIIGVGRMGQGVSGSGSQGHIDYPGARLVAICDVDRNHLETALQKCPSGTKAYGDYRDLLLDKGIDIVHIVTPPHWHATMSVEAARAGKDVWCEKPMTRTIGEGIRVMEAMARYGRMFRLNTWFRFRSDFYGYGSTVAPIKKLVQSGLLGWPLKVTINANNGFNWAFNEINVGKPLPGVKSVPPELDYDMWLGPAPFKPYHPDRVHRKFRGYWDYDGGLLGDMAQHYLDPVQYFLGKDDTSPVKVETEAPLQHPDAVGTWRKIVYTYDDGCQIVLDAVNEDAPYIQGPLGNLYRGFRSDIPDLDRKLASFPDPEPQIADFSESVRTRRRFALNEINGFRSCTLVNMGIIALRLGRTLHFDPVGLKFVQDYAANLMIHQPMRDPWNI